MNKYDNIINLERYELKYHKRMPIHNRSAIFAPFSALVGFNDLIFEEGRETSKYIELDEEKKYLLDIKLQFIIDNINLHPFINVIYFKKDHKKDGGKYINYSNNVKKIDYINNKIIFIDNTTIDIDNIYDISSDYIKM